jgi:protein-disulfide isomerase/uncharacterized membrane protein
MKTAKTDSRNLKFFLFTNLVGWALGFYGLYHRQDILNNGLLNKSFCTVSAGFDCDAVAISKYSAFFGIPVASWGMLFYAIVLVLGVLAYFAEQDGETEKSSGLKETLWTLSLVSLVPTTALALVSVVAIKTLCLFCIGNYICNLALCFFAAKFRSAKGFIDLSKVSAALKRLPQAGWLTMVILGALNLFSAPLVNAVVSGSGAGIPEAVLRDAVRSFEMQSVKTFEYDGYPSYGPATARIQIVEFSDFQCPGCTLAAKTLPAMIRAYGDQIRFTHKNYPLDNSCNPKMDRPLHQVACRAAETGYCVFKLKGSELFFKYKEQTFNAQDSLNPERVQDIATALGVGEAELKTCLADPETRMSTIKQIDEGSANGVNSTPSIFINGKKLPVGPSPVILRAIFDHELAKKL